MSERCFFRISPLSIFGLFSVSALFFGCGKPPKEQSDTTEITVNVVTPAVAVAPTSKIQPTPEPKLETPAKKTYLTKYVSKITDDGVIGIPAGIEVTVKDRVGDKLVISDGTVSLQVDESFLTNDENVSSDIRDRDLRARQIIEAKSAENQKAAYRREMDLYSSASTTSGVSPNSSERAKSANSMSAAEVARIRQRISDLEMRIGVATQMQKLKKMAPNTYRGSYEGPQSLIRERDNLRRLLE